MKTKYLTLFFLALTLNISCSKRNNYLYVVKITDGDTFVGLNTNKEHIKIRIASIDAPEKGQPYGSASKKALADMIFNKEVKIEIQDIDKYGRTIAKVYTPDNKDVSAEMLKKGYAWHFVKYSNSTYYSELETNARTLRCGLWQSSNPIPPWQWRKMSKEERNMYR